MATLFGRYEYGGELGRGATGRVFAVLDRSAGGERRAVKVVPSAEAGRLVWEFARLCQVEHPGLARARELVRLESDAPAPVALTRGTLLLIEDFVEGTSLTHRLAQWGDAPAARVVPALTVAIAVAEALTALHELSLVHGDVKPDNVLCDAELKRVTLIDLGFARPAALRSAVRGTPSFMAPELLAGVCSPAADVYALGAVLFDCLCGDLQAPDSSRAELRGDQLVRPRELARLHGAVEPGLLRVLEQLLAPDVAQRPADAGAALALLFPVAARLDVLQAPSLRYAAPSFARSPEQRAARAGMLPFTGHESLLEELVQALAQPLPAQPLLVRGPRGAGRSRLVREAIRLLQERRASRGEAVPTWVSSLDALAPLRDVSAILWLEADGQAGAMLVRAAELARLALHSLQIVLVCEPSQHVVGARHFDVPALSASAFDHLLGRLLEPDKLERALSQAARASTLGFAGRLCELAAELLREQRDVRDARAWQVTRTGEDVALTASTQELAEALAWWGSALAPKHAARLIGEAALMCAYDELRSKGLFAQDGGELGLPPGFAARLRRATAGRRQQIATRVRAAGAEPTSAFAFVAVGEAEAALRAFTDEAQRLRREGRTDAACALLEEALAWLAGEELALAWADAERARGRYASALAALSRFDSGATLLMRAELLRMSDRANEAHGLLESLRVAPAPTEERARALAARLAFDAGDLPAARAAAAALTHSSDRETEVRALEVEVLALLYAGEFASAKAERLVERASLRGREPALGFLARAPGRALALRAQVFNARGERTRAVRDLRAAVAYMHGLGEAHEGATYTLNLGLAELESGELGAALETLQQAALRLARMLRSRDLARVLFNFAAVALLIGDFERADAVLREAERELELAPDHAARALVAVLRAELALQRGALETAERVIEAALAGLPSDARQVVPIVASRAVLIALARGEIARAEARLERARSAALEDPNTLLEVLTAELGVALASGRGELAEGIAQRGLALVTEHGGERASFSERLRFVLSAIEAARGLRAPGAAPGPLRERTALARALLERALATLPRELRAKMRGVPAYARVFSADGSSERSPSEPSRWRALVRASRRLFAEPTGARVGQRVVEVALELVHAERALVVTFREGDEPYVLARSELAPDSAQKPAFSRSVIERVALEGRSLMTIEARSDERLESAASLQALHVRSVLCVELFGLGERAFLYLDDRLRPAAFDVDDLSLMEDLAELARQALQSSEQLRSEARRARRAEQQQKRLSRELVRRELTRPRELSGAPLVGESSALTRVLTTARRVAASDAPVLLTGESGTGKELLARFVHDASPRKLRSFVAESCAALADTLLESALFGHVRGAFTGADRAHKGLFETADGGTLFLDEVGEMSPSLQGKLLRVLQEGELRPLGSERTRHVDVRVIGATRRDLAALVQAGRFREDLYYRLAVVTLELPPLRDRPEDIALLVAHFVEKHARGRKVRVQPSTLRMLEHRAWPGNVRELENEVRRALALSDGEIEPLHLSSTERDLSAEAADELDLHARSEQLTRELVRQALMRADGNVTHAAQLLGISRFGLQKILKRLQLSAK